MEFTGPHLSRRQRQMVEGVMAAKPNKIIAFDLGISANTIKVYMSKLFGKVGVGSRAELAKWGREHQSPIREQIETEYELIRRHAKRLDPAGKLELIAMICDGISPPHTKGDANGSGESR